MTNTSQGLPHDEWFEGFDGPAGDVPDPSVWAPELGGGGWGDAQLQHYTATNAALTGNGCLALTARREEADLDTASGAITSARLITKSRLTLLYGTITARIRVPAGAGVWPALWALGANPDEVGWPACGEIDVAGTGPATLPRLPNCPPSCSSTGSASQEAPSEAARLPRLAEFWRHGCDDDDG